MDKRFPWTGVAGILLVGFAQLNFSLQVEPFIYWYFPLIWTGYILTVDGLLFHIDNHSPVQNHSREFLLSFLISAPFWWIFEGFNYFTGNWEYILPMDWPYAVTGTVVMKTISFATVIPAVYVTYRLIRATHFFDTAPENTSASQLSRSTLYTIIAAGVFSVAAPVLWPRYAFPLVWLCLFLLLDPVNYMWNRPSILRAIEEHRWTVPFSLAVAGLTTGFFWEFWNMWTAPRWVYNVPFVDFLRVFEMPVLGYFGYIPFSFEVYATYWFVRGRSEQVNRFCP